jgi:hypothetical protein
MLFSIAACGNACTQARRENGIDNVSLLQESTFVSVA